MLRIHFSAEDLGRIHLAPGPDPAWEALLSLHVLGGNDSDIRVQRWRTRLRASLKPAAQPLLRLAPPRGYSPDFLTPAGGVTDPEAGIESILSTSRTRLRTEVETLGQERRLPSWAAALANGRPAALRGLGTALRSYYDQALSPYWSQIRAAVDADRTTHARAFLAGGTDQLLAGLHPAVLWRAPVLHVAYPTDEDMYLDGRGLRLVPSYFCRGTPIKLRDASLSPVLVYPASRGVGFLGQRAASAGGDSLARLVGRTRAATLCTIAGSKDATGNEIARRLGISPASASEHASVLRDAGLIHSLRVGNTIRHALTPLGMELLEGQSTPSTVPETGAERQNAGCL